MKSKILVAGIFAMTAVIVALYPKFSTTASAVPVPPIAKPTQPGGEAAKIQLAILLDTSSSMSGLIDQTRNQLWQVVNEFAKAKRNGIRPTLQVAVYEYGNSGLSAKNGYIRQVTGLTGELDQVSEALFALTTNGGDEYCGYAIQTAVNELEWSRSDRDIKAIFIAGNEPFTQGPVSYQNAIEQARAKGIKVNTIHAGNFETGANTGWKDGALLAGGEYTSIDHNHKVVHIVAPQDKQLAELNAKLNQTYVPYGKEGRTKAERQIMQDRKSEEISVGLAAKRAQAKSSALYDNSSWDLVDALENGELKLPQLSAEQLPQEMQHLSEAEQKAYVNSKAKQRQSIKEQIAALSKARERYVAEQQRQQGQSEVNTMEAALVNAVRKQGQAKQYEFDAAAK